ncbi:hypothetical protein HZH68_005771 [Vespula germanica]|uniref:Uncharacterized protein n=1 Tax=Vespula germanica TaxID=30212 RepID=A0A834KH05_VESGE|nr:hypothetical protein HZH68_005771 [Vespula germanica]
MSTANELGNEYLLDTRQLVGYETLILHRGSVSTGALPSKGKKRYEEEKEKEEKEEEEVVMVEEDNIKSNTNTNTTKLTSYDNCKTKHVNLVSWQDTFIDEDFNFVIVQVQNNNDDCIIDVVKFKHGMEYSK